MAQRNTLNGCWILDKTRENWSMNKYLETMNVDPLAIEAHEKGEREHDTIHTIELSTERFKIVKRSRVNNDIIVELDIGKELIEYLPPGNRPKRMLAESDNLCHVRVSSSLQTVNGKASVTDNKRLIIENDGKSVLVQELTVKNELTGKQHTTVRYFNPYPGTPPHLVTPPNVSS